MPIGHTSNTENGLATLGAIAEKINTKFNTKYKAEDLADPKVQDDILNKYKSEGKNINTLRETLNNVIIEAGLRPPTAPQVKATTPRLASVKANATAPQVKATPSIQPTQVEKEEPTIIDHFVSGVGNLLGSIATTVASGSNNPMYGGYAPNDKVTTKEDLQNAVKFGKAIEESVAGGANAKIQGSSNKLEGDPFEAFKQGKIKEGFVQTANMVAGSLPTSIGLMNPITATGWAIGNTARETDKLEKEGVDPQKAFASAVLKTSAELLTERLLGGAKQFNKILANSGKKAGEELIRKSITKEVAKSLGEEVVGEDLNQLISNASEILIEGKKDKGFLDGLGNATIGALGGSSVFSPIIGLQTKANNAIVAKNEAIGKKKFEDIKQQSVLEKAYNNQQPNDTENQQGIPSEGFNRQEEPISTDINQETGNGTIEASRDVQGNGATQEQVDDTQVEQVDDTQVNATKQPTESPITLNVDGEDVTITNNGDNTSTISVEGKEPIIISTDEANALVEEHTNTQQLNPNTEQVEEANNDTKETEPNANQYFYETTDKEGNQIYLLDKSKVRKELPLAFDWIKRFNNELTTDNLRGIVFTLYTKMYRFKNGAEEQLATLKQLESILDKIEPTNYISKDEFKSQLKESGHHTPAQLEVFNAMVDALNTDKMPVYGHKANTGGSLIGLNYFAPRENSLIAEDPQSFVHEMGHFGFFNILPSADRLEFMRIAIDKFYGENAPSVGSKLAKTDEPMVGTNADGDKVTYSTNVSDNFSEYFAEQFNQWYLHGKVSNEGFKAIFEKIADYLVKVVEKLKGGKYIDKDLIVFFDKIIDENRKAKEATNLNPNINEEQQDEAESNANDSNGKVANGQNEGQQEQVVGEESKGDEAGQGNDEKGGSEKEVAPTIETTTEGVASSTPSTLPNRIPLPRKGKNAITDEEIRQHNAEVDQKIADLDAEFKSASDELKDALITLSNAKKEHEKAKAKRTFLGSTQKQFKALKEAQAKVDSLQDTIKNHAKRRKALEDSKLKGIKRLEQKEIPLHELKIKELSQKLKEATKNIGVYFRAGFDTAKLAGNRKLLLAKSKLKAEKEANKARLENLKINNKKTIEKLKEKIYQERWKVAEANERGNILLGKQKARYDKLKTVSKERINKFKDKLKTVKEKHKARLESIKNKAQLLKEKKKTQGKLKSLKKEALISPNDKKILNDLLNNFNSKVLDQVSDLGNVIEYINEEVEKIANGEKHNLDMAKIKEINDIIKELNKANREKAEKDRENNVSKIKSLSDNKSVVKSKLAQLFNITATDEATLDKELAKQGYDNDEINKIVLKHAGKQPADLEHEVEKIAESDIVIEGEAKTALEQRLEENAGLGQELLDIYEQVSSKVEGLDILDDMTAEEIESLPTRTIKRAIYELSKVDNTEDYTPLLMKPLVDELNTIKALRDANDNSVGQVQPLFTRGKGNNKLYGEVGKAIDYLRHKILFGVMGLGTNLGQFSDMLSGYNKKNRALNNDIYKLDDIETQINKAEQLNEQDVDRIKKGVETLKGGVHNKGGQAVTQFVNMLLQYVPDNKGDYHREQQRKVVQLIKNAIKLNEANPNELDQDLIKALNEFNDKVLSKLDENFWDNPDAIDQFEAILKKEGYVAELNLAKDIIKIYKAKIEDSQKYRVDIGSEAPNIENYVPNLYVNKSNKAEPSSVKTVIKKMFDLRQANSSKLRQKNVSAYSENGRYQLPITDLEYEHRSWLKDEHFAIHVAPLMVAGLNNMANPLIMAEMAKRNNLSTDNTDANKEAFIKAVNEDVKDVYERAYQRYNPSIMMEDVVKAINPLFGNTVAVNVYNVGSFIKQSGTAVGQTLLHSAMNLKLPDLSFKSPSYIELIDKYTNLNSSIVPKDANLRFGKWADKVSNTKLFKAIAPIANKASKADSYIDTTFRKIFSRPDIAGKNVLFNMYARLNAEKYGFKNDDKLYDNLLEAVKRGDKKALEFIKETANTANAPFGAPTGDVSKAGLSIRQIPTIGNIANAMIPLTSIRSSMVSNMLSEIAKLTSSYSTKADKISATRNISSIVSSQIMFQAIALTGIGQMANSWMEYYAIAFKELMNDIVGDDDEDEVRAKLLEAQKIMDTYNYQHMRSIGDALLVSAPSGITETMIPTAPYMLIQDGLNNMTREALLSQYGSQQEKTMKNLYNELNAGELEKLKGDVAFKNKTIIGQANNKYKGDDKFSDFYKNFRIVRAINSSELVKKAMEDANYSKQDLADAVTSFIMATTQSVDMISTFTGAKSQNEKYFKLKAKALKPQSTKEGEAKDEEYSKSVESKRSELNEAEKIKFDIKQGISRAILIQFGRLAKGDELTGRIYIDDRSIIDPMTNRPYSKYGVPFEQMGAYAPMLEKVLKNK